MDISRPQWASKREWIDWCNNTPIGVLKRGAELEALSNYNRRLYEFEKNARDKLKKNAIAKIDEMESQLDGAHTCNQICERPMCVARRRIEELEAEVRRLREALQSIASNTCCEPCQEAKLVAQAALTEGD